MHFEKIFLFNILLWLANLLFRCVGIFWFISSFVLPVLHTGSADFWTHQKHENAPGYTFRVYLVCSYPLSSRMSAILDCLLKTKEQQLQQCIMSMVVDWGFTRFHSPCIIRTQLSAGWLTSPTTFSNECLWYLRWYAHCLTRGYQPVCPPCLLVLRSPIHICVSKCISRAGAHCVFSHYSLHACTCCCHFCNDWTQAITGAVILLSSLAFCSICIALRLLITLCLTISMVFGMATLIYGHREMNWISIIVCAPIMVRVCCRGFILLVVANMHNVWRFYGCHKKYLGAAYFHVPVLPFCTHEHTQILAHHSTPNDWPGWVDNGLRHVPQHTRIWFAEEARVQHASCHS